MKKIEKTFYVSDADMENIKAGRMIERLCYNYEGRGSKYTNKITITCEIPEKKVTISESEFDEIYNESLLLRGYCKALGVELKQKLFGEVE